MPTKTPRLGLTLLAPAQEQPEVTINADLILLDQLGGSVEVEAMGDSPGQLRATKLVFVNCTVEVQTDGVVVITPPAGSTGGSGGGGSPIDVTDGTNDVVAVTAIRFITGATVAEASAGVADVTIEGGGGGGGGTTTLTGSAALQQLPHQYWRVNVLSAGFGGNVGFAEITMASVAAGANLLTGGTPSAQGADGGYEAALAVDGDPSTRWNYAASAGWWQYEFTSPVAIRQVTITAREDAAPTTAPSFFTLQFSDDGVTFTDLQTFDAAIPWTTGQVQTFTAASFEVAATSGTVNITPESHPASPAAFDDEFEGTVFDVSKWTWDNQGAATATLDHGSVVLTADPSGTENNNIIYEPISGATWEVTASRLIMSVANTSNNPSCGIALKGSGGYLLCGMYMNGGVPTLLVKQITDPTTFHNNALTSGVLPAAAYGPGSLALDLRVAFDSTNLIFSVSATGFEGTFVTVHSETPGTWVGTVTDVGLFANYDGTAIRLICDSIRKTG